MRLTVEQVRRMAKAKTPRPRDQEFVDDLAAYGPDVGLNTRVRLAHFLAQVLHESGDLRYAEELWGPTKAQARYEGRKDLGNTSPGDGYRFRGRGYMQLTGRANYTDFGDWYAATWQKDATAVLNAPEMVMKSPLNVVSALWYWDTRGLNRFADDNDIENLSVRINGGYNGYSDRLERYGRAALVMLGYGTDAGERRRFQFDHDLDVDGHIGPKSRAALHAALKAKEIDA